MFKIATAKMIAKVAKNFDHPMHDKLVVWAVRDRI